MIAVVIPCFRVKDHILKVLSGIGRETSAIYVVDDCCPEGTADHVEAHCVDSRVRVIRHASNQGVGGAVCTGYEHALADGASVIVKIDGDNQMNPQLLPRFIAPVTAGRADYCKGNRFYDLSGIGRMPGIRIFGNAVLSFLSKLSTGYWNIFDPTNGYTAIHAEVARRLPFEKLSKRYFFETDMLFQLNNLRACVLDVPMDSVYENEKSNLRVSSVIAEFLVKHTSNMCKRIFYNYFLRDFTIASVELLLGVVLFVFGTVYGVFNWFHFTGAGVQAPVGVVMLAALPIITGMQLVLAFLSFDISSTPSTVIHPFLADIRTGVEKSSGNDQVDS